MAANESPRITSENPQDPVLDYSSATPSTASTAMQEHSSFLPSHKYTNSVPDKEEVLSQEGQENSITQSAQPVQPVEQQQTAEPMKKSVLQAAAEDRQIALSVWKDNAHKDDEIRDALGRMLGWVERLVSDHDHDPKKLWAMELSNEVIC
jgi:hypothetical protein